MCGTKCINCIKSISPETDVCQQIVYKKGIHKITREAMTSYRFGVRSILNKNNDCIYFKRKN